MSNMNESQRRTNTADDRTGQSNNDTAGTSASRAPQNTRRCRNRRPCGTCATAQLRCDIEPPNSPTLCARCRRLGLDKCPPYVPRASRVSRSGMLPDYSCPLPFYNPSYNPPSPYSTPYPPANNLFPIPMSPPPNYTPLTGYSPLPQQNLLNDPLYRLSPSPPYNGTEIFPNDYSDVMANTSPYMAGSQAGVWHTHNGH